MARRKQLLKLNQPSSQKSNIVSIASDSKLPHYSRYFDTDKGVRFFFEPSKSTDEFSKTINPSISKICYAGELSGRNRPSSFYPYAVEVLGTPLAQHLARLLINYSQNSSGSSDVITQMNVALSRFLDFLKIHPTKPRSLTDITQDMMVAFINYLDSSGQNTLVFNNLRRLLITSEELKYSEIKLLIAYNIIKTNSSNEEEVNINEILEQGYSDKEIVQLLAYVFFELDQMTKAVDRLHRVKSAPIEPYDIPHIDKSSTEIKSLMQSGEEGYECLIDNVVKYHAPRTKKSNSQNQSYTETIRARAIWNKFLNEYECFQQYVRKDVWAYKVQFQDSDSQSDNHINIANIYYRSHHDGTSPQFTICLMIYVMLTTGLNFSTLLSWKREINGKPWFENFDKFFGSDEQAAFKDRAVVIYGRKSKTGVAGSKKIPTSIPITSPLFKYLKAYDSAYPENRDSFFAQKDKSFNRKMITNFLKINPIYSNDGERWTTIVPKNFRKVFAGHKLLSLLGDVKSSDELIYKLKEALNHGEFDTTLFSYLMKTGIGNQTLDAAIVTMTSDLLEKSLAFKGKILDDNQKNEDATSVFLCDCSDPSSPSHSLQINNGHCRKYDMCLGCERAEVYSEHLPNICYRILQYDKIKEENNAMFRATMEDRYAIALDTLQKFKLQHHDGFRIVGEAYQLANKHFTNNEPLLPSVLQIENM
jgi:hypothetical protein